MQSRRHSRSRARTLVLGTPSTDTLGMPLADIPEPMGFWPKAGISHQSLGRRGADRRAAFPPPPTIKKQPTYKVRVPSPQA